MNSTDLDRLVAHIASLPDRDVIKAMASPGDYTPEAMVIYDSEAKRRGIKAETVRPVAVQEAQRKRDKLASSSSFKGIGEKLYGMRSFREDGSYLTTKWFVFLHLPIYPISSLRIRGDGKGGISVSEVLPLQWRQVVDTYCFVIFSWAGIVMTVRLLAMYPFPLSEFISMAILGLPYLFLYVVRRRAQRKIVASG
jgi:hypothetical protein